MGCCNNSQSFKDQMSIKLVFECIINKKMKIFGKYFTEPNKNQDIYLSFLNNERGHYNTLAVNTLGLSLIEGNYEAFTFFHRLGCEIKIMEKLLNQQGLTSLEILCLKGHSKILSYYLPFYKEYLSKYPTQELNHDFQLSLEFKPYPNNQFTPVQLATLNEHIQIITIFYQDIKGKSEVFKEIDLDYVEKKSGLNCALLAVKSGNFAMVKYLYSNYSCDFCICDAVGNNAVEIAVIERQKRPFKDYLKIIGFLVNVVGVEAKWDFDHVATEGLDQEIEKGLEQVEERGRDLDCFEG